MACPAWPMPPPPTDWPLVSTMNTGTPGVGVKPAVCSIAQHCASARTGKNQLAIMMAPYNRGASCRWAPTTAMRLVQEAGYLPAAIGSVFVMFGRVARSCRNLTRDAEEPTASMVPCVRRLDFVFMIRSRKAGGGVSVLTCASARALIANATEQEHRSIRAPCAMFILGRVMESQQHLANVLRLLKIIQQPPYRGMWLRTRAVMDKLDRVVCALIDNLGDVALIWVICLGHANDAA